MFGIRIIPIFIACLLLAGCKKENGKHTYEMCLTFDSGDIFTDDGKMFEKHINGKKYRQQIHDAFNLNESQGKALYLEVFNGYIFLKEGSNKFVCSDQLYLTSSTPVAFANGQSGSFKGDVYFEGTYTQKGRAYTVDNGTFEFIWRDLSTGQPVNSIIYKGTWTLKRK
ncbi:hypothetical protein D3C71_794850 [compost metagenome]